MKSYMFILLVFLVTSLSRQSAASSGVVAPVDRLTEPQWVRRRIEKRIAPNRDKAQVVFIGDSLTQGWEEAGKDVWAKYYVPRQALNLGNNGDRIENILWRLSHGDLDGLCPKVVILLISADKNDSGQEDSPDSIAAGTRAIIDQIGTRLPQAKVLLLAMLPRGGTIADTLRVNHNQTNARLSQLVDNKHVFFLNINDRFLHIDGSLIVEFMPDFKHLNANGYANFADALEPTLAELLEEAPILLRPPAQQTSSAASPIPASASMMVSNPLVRADGVVEIGNRLELFVDDLLIQQISGNATQVLHKPVPQEVVLVTDQPWEGNTCAFYSLFADGNRFRMYYRAGHSDTYDKAYGPSHTGGTSYAESQDGIHWTRPLLGLTEFNGSTQNNLIGILHHKNWAQNFTPMKNQNPQAPRYAKYIATTSGWATILHLSTSSDAFHWTDPKESVITTNGHCDSQNTLFWDSNSKLYRCYYRFIKPWPVARQVKTCVSPDLKHWTELGDLKYVPEVPSEELYTNAIQVYPRSPHLLIGFPTILLRGRNSQVEPEFMSSRDGVTFRRWPEKLIPTTAPKDRDGNRSNYIQYGLLELPGRPKEYSIYANEAYYKGPASRLRRFSYRVDGFVSISAGLQGGELLTKPLVFEGKNLVINAKTTSSGSIRVEVRDAQGQAISGLSLTDCLPFTGDEIEHIIRWQSTPQLNQWAGKPIQLRFVLKEADLYSIRFR